MKILIFRAWFKNIHYFCKVMIMKHNKNGQFEKKKRFLLKQLENKGCLWSYAPNQNDPIDDDLLIEKALLYLEFEDLHSLSELYPIRYMRDVWRKRLVSQNEYYGIINWLLAAMFFDIKKPDRYLKIYGKPRLETGA